MGNPHAMDSAGKIRVEESLRIKIGEAKITNLPSSRNNTSIQRNGSHLGIYCALSLDQEEIFKTAVVKSSNPFFGEEFNFEVPRKFRYLSIYVYDKDGGKCDRKLGKVAIKREDLSAIHNDGKDHWFPIRPVTLDSEVQGKVHFNARFEGTDTGENLHFEVFDACDLTSVNGMCDPFVKVTARFTNGKCQTFRTKCKRKCNSPNFDERFTFTIPKEDASDEADWSEIVASVYHEGAGGNNIFIGEVKISLAGSPQRTHAESNSWYYLQPRKKRVTPRAPVSSLSSAVMDENCVGTLRMNVQYFVDHILPPDSYDRLRQLIVKSASIQPITSSAVYLLGEILPCKVDVAHSLVRILFNDNQIVPVMRSLAFWEISKVSDVNTIFRGNTLVSKLMDEAMKYVGMRYLHETLQAPLEKILMERNPCEIDPFRIKDPKLIHQNLSNLKIYVEEIFQAIITSAMQCPKPMCQLFNQLKEIAVYFFPDNKEIRYTVISGFIFLRFFAPAILGPRLFDLTTEQIDPQTNRTLTLISKMIQSLGNLVSSKTTSCKEEFMASMYQTFYNDTHVTAVKRFLEIISANSATQFRLDKPVILKEGILTKRAQGRRRFGRKNFKKRYFKLTTVGISYARHKGKASLWELPLSNILAVEKLSYDSFQKNNMIQIVYPERTLYIQTNNCVEEKEWLDLLIQACRSNEKRLNSFHPSAFINGQWLCCKSRNEFGEGCNAVTFGKEDGTKHLDVNRELSRLHTLIFAHMERLENVSRACDERYGVPSSLIEDAPSCYQTLVSLQDAAYALEQEQRGILRCIARDMKYGSKQAPIGDDNYLLLAGRLDSIPLKKPALTTMME